MPPIAMYSSSIWCRGNFTPKDVKNNSVSYKLNGNKFIRWVTLLYKPPRALISFFFIHEDAEPQAISNKLSIAESMLVPKEFQCRNETRFGCIQPGHFINKHYLL